MLPYFNWRQGSLTRWIFILLVVDAHSTRKIVVEVIGGSLGDFNLLDSGIYFEYKGDTGLMRELFGIFNPDSIDLLGITYLVASYT